MRRRRGRADSGDTLPYAVDREIEDIDALIAEAGGSAHVFGVSSGGGLALEAAAAGTAIVKLAVYEVPYCVAGDSPQRAREYLERPPSRTRTVRSLTARHTWPTQRR